MSKNYLVDQEYIGLDFSKEPLNPADYEDCTFKNCVFKHVVLSKHNFINCTFSDCDFSMANVTNTGIRSCIFSHCKMLGIHFENAHSFDFGGHFKHCNISLASFYKLSLKNCSFQACQLHEVDFSEANLTALTLTDCELHGAIFDGTILEKTDFREAIGYQIDLEKNRVFKAKFSLEGLPGLLAKYKIDIE